MIEFCAVRVYTNRDCGIRVNSIQWSSILVADRTLQLKMSRPAPIKVPVRHENYIPVPKKKLIARLTEQFDDATAREQFAELCRIAEAIYHFEHLGFSENLKHDFSLFDSTTSDDEQMSSAEIEDAEDRFLEHFHTLMRKGNFRPLTNHDVDIAHEQEYLFHLPIRIDWNKFDDQLLNRFADDSNSSDFGRRVLIYHRGVGKDRATGYFFLPKIDILVSRTLLWLWNLIAGLWRIFARPRPEMAEEGLSSMDVEETPGHVHEQRFIERISLRNCRINPWSLLRKTTLQEPTFEELVILFRFATPDDEPKDRAIYIKTFRDIPMADLEVIFPAKRISMRPMDLLKLTIVGFAGFVLVLFKLLTAVVLNPIVALAAIGSAAGYVSKIYFGYQASKKRYNQLVADSLYNKTMNNDLGVLLYLVDSLEEQELKELLLGYHLLLQHGPMTAERLDAKCELFIKDELGEEVDFEVRDALDKLVSDELVKQDGGMYAATPLSEAIARLDEKWDNYFHGEKLSA